VPIVAEFEGGTLEAALEPLDQRDRLDERLEFLAAMQDRRGFPSGCSRP
jgi:hypothetical protein